MRIGGDNNKRAVVAERKYHRLQRKIYTLK